VVQASPDLQRPAADDHPDDYNFTGKAVHPVTTYAMSGLGTPSNDYARHCKGARNGEGLVVPLSTLRFVDKA
jgi:hypothetical protein